MGPVVVASASGTIKTRAAGGSANRAGNNRATTTTRTNIKIADQEAFLASLPPEERDPLFELKLSNSRAKAAAKAAFEEDGEQLPGVEAGRITSLSVRLSDG